MKKLCLFLFSSWNLLFTDFVIAQNWKPINPDYVYNYQKDNTGFDGLFSIWMDSSGLEGNDSVYYLNRTVDTCFGCQSTAYRLLNQPLFLQRKMLSRNDSIVVFSDTARYFLRPFASLSETWIFDSAVMVSCSVTSAQTENIFGAVDSVKTIILSTGDTIKISKDNGILLFPFFSSPGKYFRLTGIEPIGAGETVPMMKDFYNFNPGDIFEYYQLDYHHHLSYSSYISRHWKDSILSRHNSTDTILFSIHRITRDTSYDFGTHIYHYFSTDTIFNATIFTGSANNFLNKRNKEIFVFDEDMMQPKPINFSEDLFFNTKTKWVGTYFLEDLSGDTSNQINWKYQSAYTYGVNRGLIFGYSYDNPNGSSNIYEDSFTYLIACNVNGVQYGTFTPDSLYTIEVLEIAKHELNISVYPQPASDKIYFTVPDSTQEITVELLDATGRKLIEKILRDHELWIDIHHLPEGMYFLRVDNDAISGIKKFIKQ